MNALLHAWMHLARLRWLGAAFCALAMLCATTHASALTRATAHARVDTSADITTTASASKAAQTKTRVGVSAQNSPLHVWILRSASVEQYRGFSPTLPETASGPSNAAEGGGMLRRGANVGAFSDLEVPMQMRYVKQAAEQGGVGLQGVKVQIIRDPSLVGRGVYGYVPPRGSTMQLYPDAFSNMENLVKTLGHERTHIMQLKLYGAPTTAAEAAANETAAYGVESSFWQYFQGRF